MAVAWLSRSRHLAGAFGSRTGTCLDQLVGISVGGCLLRDCGVHDRSRDEMFDDRCGDCVWGGIGSISHF